MNEEHSSDYVLGHADAELKRLIEQSRFYGELTSQFLRSAGISRGMRVLDVGCGVGDVSFHAADLVRPKGTVLGVDNSADAIALARRRAAASKIENVTFKEHDLTDLNLNEQYDALIGRLVLMYFPDPASVLTRLMTHVSPGGIIAFQEMDMSVARSVPESPLYAQCCRWILSTFSKAKVATDFGPRLHSILQQAGLPAPEMTFGARIGGGPDAPGYEYATDVIRSLLPMAERFGVTTAGKVELGTLTNRIRDEVTASGGVVISPALVGAWTNKPA